MKALLLLLALVSLGGCVLVEWTADEFFNPLEEPEKCGRHESSPSYVCDPNGIITVRQADFLDHILLNMQNETDCPCSTNNCESRAHSKGYIIAIALVKKLKRPDNVPDNEMGRMGLAQTFVYDLQRKHWVWGKCDEVTIIFFSKDDGILMTTTGVTPARKLTGEVTNYIQKELVRFFQKGGNVGQGLHYLTINYRHVLDNYKYSPVLYADTPIHSTAAMATISIATSIITTLLAIYFC
ncbi:uncharacterized protein LOC128238482 isoform X2 [Mya arenaria]|nr:uncharacterized protein LOC128238482 isoform X2 [Mya arenaria]XP_052810404.1 uncharacterized protein LOC128238482 isoform X2 [Mya arenaria]XP_052810405.1 uncharacterized protein LOC128238482 isoform X2 [Mya arenaria]